MRATWFSRSFLGVVLLTLTGCAVVRPAPVEKRESMSIATINALDVDAKHVHIGTTIFANFELAKPGTDWKISALLEDTTRRYLGSKPGVKVRALEAPKWLMDERNDIVTTGWDSFPLNAKLIPQFEVLALQEKVDVFVVLAPYMAQMDPQLHPRFAGHGLYTRCFVGSCSAKPLSNFIVVVVETRPTPRVTTLPGLLVAEKTTTLPSKSTGDINLGRDLKALPVEEFEKVRPQVRARIEALLYGMLDQAGLEPAMSPAP